jgi:ABC-type Mn2+/Zn2+ transport system permease subunit
MFGFLIVPPMIAGRLAIGMRNVSVMAAVLGAGVALIGFAAAYRLDWPTGPTDVALAGVVLALVTAAQAMRTFVFRAAAK